jgi:hypothetical protein
MSNPITTVLRAVACGAAALALAAGPAAAIPIGNGSPPLPRPSGFLSPDARDANVRATASARSREFLSPDAGDAHLLQEERYYSSYGTPVPAAPPAPVPSTPVSGTGFDWPSAAIGAGFLGLVMLSAAGVGLVHRARSHTRVLS